MFEETEVLMSPKKIGSGKLANILQELSSDEGDSDSEFETEDPVNPKAPWMQEFNLYLNTTETVPKDMSIVQWWGVCA